MFGSGGGGCAPGAGTASPWRRRRLRRAVFLDEVAAEVNAVTEQREEIGRGTAPPKTCSASPCPSPPMVGRNDVMAAKPSNSVSVVAQIEEIARRQREVDDVAVAQVGPDRAEAAASL